MCIHSEERVWEVSGGVRVNPIDNGLSEQLPRELKLILFMSTINPRVTKAKHIHTYKTYPGWDRLHTYRHIHSFLLEF